MEAGYAGAHASASSDAAEKLEKSYGTSDANTLEIIHACGTMREASDDVCSAAGGVLVNSCGFEVDPGWLATCNGDPVYKQCVKGAARDCTALSVCGFEQLNRLGACGGGAASGTAGCQETTYCESRCAPKDIGCICACTAKMSRAVALGVALQNTCNNLHCASCEPGPGCEQCFSRHCAPTFDRACKGR